MEFYLHFKFITCQLSPPSRNYCGGVTGGFLDDYSNLCPCRSTNLCTEFSFCFIFVVSLYRPSLSQVTRSVEN